MQRSLNAWRAARFPDGRQSEQETVVRSIGEDNEINLKISQDYLTQRKRAYCHMVMDE